MQAECDINQIMAKFQKTGMITHIKERGATYGDMPMAEDFHEAMSLVAEANTMFAELPSTVRERFKNDAAQFLEFVNDEDNRDAMVEMGLLPALEGPELVQENLPEVLPPDPSDDGSAAS